MALPAAIAASVGSASASTTATASFAATAAGSGAGGGALMSAANVAQLAGAANQLTQSAKSATHWTAQLASKITGQLAKALTMWIGFLDAVAKPIADLVQIANPAIMEAFTRAVNDAFGVVGRSLIPVLNAFTQVARKVGDLMAGLEPVFEPAITAIAELVRTIGDEFVKTAKENAPVFEMMAAMLKSAAQAATAMTKVLGELWRAFNRLVGSRIARLLGFSGDSFDPNRSAVGSAARNARFVEPKAIADEAIRSSLMMGVGQKKDPEQALRDMDDTITKILDFMRDRWGQAKGFAEGATTGALGSETVDEHAQKVSPAYRAARWIGSKVF